MVGEFFLALALASRPPSVTYFSWTEFTKAIDGPSEPLAEPCAWLWDFDSSGHVDLADAAHMQAHWSCNDVKCGVFHYSPAGLSRQ